MLFLFQNTREAIRADKACVAAGLPAKVIPVPRSVASDCGMAIECADSIAPEVRALLDNERVNYTMLNEYRR
jgi:hypothetical protein